MASVAACPHCYLQLVIPDGLDGDARLECPICSKEFELKQAVVRTIREAIPVEHSVVGDSEASPETDELAMSDESLVISDRMSMSEVNDDDIERQAVPEAPENLLADEELTKPAADEIGVDEARLEMHGQDFDAEVEEDVDTDNTDEIEEPTPIEAEVAEVSPTRPATLAELMTSQPPSTEAEEPGPSFDLPNVPLARETASTIEFGSVSELGAATNTEFELDEVDFTTVSAPSEEPVFDDSFAKQSRLEEEVPAAAIESEPSESVDFPDAKVLIGPPPRRRRRSPVRMLAGVALGGVFGLAIAYYVLMWAYGPSGDFLQVAQYMPSPLLPGSFSPSSTPRLSVEESPAPKSQLPVALSDDIQPPSNEPAEVNAGGNAQASYVETIESLPAAGDTSSENASSPIEALEPERFDDMPAAPLPTAPVADVNAPLRISGEPYSSSELEARLAAAKRAQAGLIDGDLSDQSVRRTKGLSYAKLCDLAQAMVFVEPSDNAATDTQLKQRAKQFFIETLSDPHTRDEVAHITPIWIESPHRRHGGVFVAGTLGGGRIAGDIYEYELATLSGEYVVLSSHPIDAAAEAAGDPLVIVGMIVEHPTADVAGYAGSAPRAIWAADALRLE